MHKMLLSSAALQRTASLVRGAAARGGRCGAYACAVAAYYREDPKMTTSCKMSDRNELDPAGYMSFANDSERHR